MTLPAYAQTTFATFSNASSNNFTYLNGANTFGTTTVTIPVNFTFDLATMYGPAFVPIAATLSFTSTGAPTVDGDNHLQLSNITMSITANTPGIYGSNLLTLTGSSGAINGTADGNSVPVSGDTAIGNIVAFSSAYLNFGSTTQRVFSLTTSDASPNYTIAGNDRPVTYTGTYVGTFSSLPVPTVVVPESGTAGLLGIALPLLGGVWVARRRKK